MLTGGFVTIGISGAPIWGLGVGAPADVHEAALEPPSGLELVGSDLIDPARFAPGETAGMAPLFAERRDCVDATRAPNLRKVIDAEKEVFDRVLALIPRLEATVALQFGMQLCDTVEAICLDATDHLINSDGPFIGALPSVHPVFERRVRRLEAVIRALLYSESLPAATLKILSRIRSTSFQMLGLLSEVSEFASDLGKGRPQDELEADMRKADLGKWTHPTSRGIVEGRGYEVSASMVELACRLLDDLGLPLATNILWNGDELVLELPADFQGVTGLTALGFSWPPNQDGDVALSTYAGLLGWKISYERQMVRVDFGKTLHP